MNKVRPIILKCYSVDGEVTRRGLMGLTFNELSLSHRLFLSNNSSGLIIFDVSLSLKN